MQTKKITKAVIPVAGLGTRFLPASKSIAKEMATVVDRPVIDYVVQEAVQAGIKHIVLVNHAAKTAIEDYFDTNYELEDNLQKKAKFELLKLVQNILPKDVTISSVRQGRALGLGHAVLCAQHIIGNEPFAVLLPDVLVDSSEGNDLANMLQAYTNSQVAQIMVDAVPQQLVSQYGVVDLAGNTVNKGQSVNMCSIVEKPSIEQAPSNLAVVGRYILPAKIFSLLENTAAGAGGEIQLTDAIAKLIETDVVQAYNMCNLTFDCGSKTGFLQATMHYAAKHPELQELFCSLVKQYAK